MGYTPKDWVNETDHQGPPASPPGTPLSAAALEDLETRVTDHIETVFPGVNVWESEADPGAVTDWGPVINALITGGARHLVFDEHDFPFSTQIDLESLRTATFEGGAGFGWTDASDPVEGTASRLIWEGTGAGSAIILGHSNGVIFRNLFIAYSSGTYTGHLIDLGSSTGDPPSSFPTFINCQIVGIQVAGNRLKNAASLVRISNGQGSVYPIIRGCGLGGAQSLVMGYESGTSGVSGNDMLVEGCQLADWEDAAFMNVGLYWRISSCTFEFTDTASTIAFNTDHDFSGTKTSHMWVTDCTFWDPSAPATQSVLKQQSGSPMTAIFRGGWAGHFNGYTMEFLSTGTVIIEDFKFGTNIVGDHPVIDLGTSAGSAAKDLVRIVGCSIGGGDNTGLTGIDNIDGGHKEIQIHSLDPFSGAAGGAGKQVRTLVGQERVGANNSAEEIPAVALHAGQTNLDIYAPYGTDLAGIIVIHATGTTTAGSLLDITFGTPLVAGYEANSSRTPHIILSPIEAGPLVNASAANYWAAQPYAKVTSSVTGWELGTVNALTVGQHIAVAYRVVML